MKSTKAIGAVSRWATSENFDLYLLAAASFAFTVLGFTNALPVTTLASVVIALLALLAISQIRSRSHVSLIAKSQYRDPLAAFSKDFGSDFTSDASQARSYLFVGHTMVRSVQTMRNDMTRILNGGGNVQILVLDPTDEELLHVAGRSRADYLRGRITSTIDELESLRARTRGHLEVRVSSFASTIGVHAFDCDTSDGTIYVQHYEYKAPQEAAPIFRFTVNDGSWYRHYTHECRRMWQDASPWPLSPTETLMRMTRPLFKDTFGSELTEAMTRAKDILITGVTRTTLIRDNYNRFEALLKSGGKIRFLLVDPESTAIALAAHRYYAARSPHSAQERVRHALGLLEELAKSTNGRLTVRLTDHPLAMGVIAIDSPLHERSASSALFIEYYSYQAAGEPKFIIEPGDATWFEHFLAEATLLWNEARPHPAADKDATSEG